MNILKQKVFMEVLVLAIVFSSLPLKTSALTYQEIKTGSVLGTNVYSYPYSTSSLVNDSGTIYFIYGTYKIPFTNWDAFVGLGYSARNVISASLENYVLYPNYVISSAKSTHPWGSWLLNNNVVYYVTQDGLIGVPDETVFVNNGGEWKFVVYANSYDLAVLKAKPNLPLLTENDSRITKQSSDVPAAPTAATGPVTSFVPVPTPTTQVTPTVTPTPVYGETINTLNFFINSSGKALTGSHPLSMTQSGQTINYVKWDSDSYETYTYDNSYIYLKEDHSGSPVPGSYTYSVGKWMKTNMKVGEKIDSSDNQIQNFAVSADSCTPGASGSNPYSTTLLQHESSYDLGGDLGIQDVIVLMYDYRTGSYTDYEKSYYARGLGLVKWELYRDSKLIQTSIFNKYSATAPIEPNLKISCANTSLVPKNPTTISGFTSMLYSCILQNTAPDADGLTYWQQNLQNGTLDARAIYTEFYKIQGTLNPPISNATFTKQLYRCALFRDADEASYNSVLSGLNNNILSRNSLVQVVLNSNEFSNNVLPKLNAFLPAKPSAIVP